MYIRIYFEYNKIFGTKKEQYRLICFFYYIQLVAYLLSKKKKKKLVAYLYYFIIFVKSQLIKYLIFLVYMYF